MATSSLSASTPPMLCKTYTYRQQNAVFETQATDSQLTNDAITMFPSSFESLSEQSPEFKERRASNTAQHFNVFRRQLKRCSFKSNISWCITEYESEIDMDEVPVSIQEDVAVVSVFNLEEERYY
jgi:hypothetical protein